MIRISHLVEAAIVAHARRDAPRECCGLLIGRGDVVEEAFPATNASELPDTRYLVDPRDYFAALRRARARGDEVIGAYHSHPRSPAHPSPTDAAEGFANFIFLIVGLAADPPELTAWHWEDGNFTRVPLVRFSKGNG